MPPKDGIKKKPSKEASEGLKENPSKEARIAFIEVIQESPVSKKKRKGKKPKMREREMSAVA